MKAHTPHERVLNAILHFERELSGKLTVTGTEFCDAVVAAFSVFAGDEHFGAIHRHKESEGGLRVVDNRDGGIFVDDRSAIEGLLKKNHFVTAHDNVGSVIKKKYRSWLLVPVSAKKETYLALILARTKGRFHKEESNAASKLGSFLTEYLFDIRTKNRKAATLADQTRHELLLRTQASLRKEKPDTENIACAIDWSAGTGSDMARSFHPDDETMLVCVCDVTADDFERHSGLVYIDTWLAILARTSIDVPGMLQRLNVDMVRRTAECYVAIALIRYSKKKALVELAGCGNVTAIYFNHDSMSVRYYDFGPAAGIAIGEEIVRKDFAVKAGDIFCLCTDGIHGTKKKNGSLFGAESVGEIVKKNYYLSAHDLSRKILEAVAEKSETGVNRDDRTVQIVKIDQEVL